MKGVILNIIDQEQESIDDDKVIVFFNWIRDVRIYTLWSTNNLHSITKTTGNDKDSRALKKPQIKPDQW